MLKLLASIFSGLILEQAIKLKQQNLTRKCSILNHIAEKFLMKRAFFFSVVCDPGIDGP